MIFKTIIYLCTFFVVGCGVMNNPNKDSETENVGAILDGETVLISKIFDGSFNEIDIQTEFGFSYKVLDSNLSLNNFSDELNSVAPDVQIALWDKKMLNANVDFEKDNIMIYAFVSKSCYFKDAVSNDEIKISYTKQTCDNSEDISFVYVYKISKELGQIRVKVEEEDVVIILME